MQLWSLPVGVKCHSVYFFHPPTPAQVLARLQEVTGLAVGVAAQEEGCLELFRPALPTRCIALGWSEDRLGKLRRIRDAVPGLYEPLFPDHPHCVVLWIEPPSSIRRFRYLESALLFVLQEFGGQIERPSPVHRWAGKKWADMPPLGMWEALIDKLR